MPKESYTTFGVDVALMKLLEGIPNGRYVDVGCWKPDEYSNTYALYKLGWRGICIDPNPDFKESFAQIRPDDTFLNCAVGEKGQSEYHMYDYSMANALIPPPVNSRLGITEQKKIMVDVVPLVEIFKQSPPVHLLSVDTEGYDIIVLESNDWDVFRPLAIVIEDYDFDIGKKRPEVANYLKDKRYVKLLDYYSDSVFLEREFARKFTSDYE